MSSRTQPAIPVPDSFPTEGGNQAQGPFRYLALHTLGWKAFQDLCAQICEEILHRTVSVYREAQDGGQDAVFLLPPVGGEIAKTATVQCKFTSDPNRHLRLSDLTQEKQSIIDLVSSGQAHSYYFITNMSVDAPVAADIRSLLTSLGVVEPHVFGRERITMEIRNSSRLRALVPRVYGLGDLSIILDERRADQTKALLGHLMPSLGVYVPTTAHRSAVRILGEHGIVLLIGAPASGKSMLASILATTALNGDGHQCFQSDGPGDLLGNWNPNEPGRFYWIDDAFGPNQLRDDFVDHWISIMNKVKAAIAAGNRFVLTSRTHVWAAAKLKLGMRNHPKFANETAVVAVGSLSPEERAQILYNHLKAGNQKAAWKQQIKPHLDSVASDTSFLPEIAKRLGDKNHTAGIVSIPKDLIRFVKEPMAFLIETIGELNNGQRAALTIVFLYRSKLPIEAHPAESWKLVGDKFGVTIAEIINALPELEGTFLAIKSEGAKRVWTFFHPTIADALSSILGHRPDLVDLYLRGVRVEELLTEVVCEGATAIRDAVIIPAEMNDLLVSRLLETPDEENLNRQLFAFLGERASLQVLTSLINWDSNLLMRNTSHYWRCRHDPKIRLYARAHALGLLPQNLREIVVSRLENAIFNNLDGSILDDDLVLALIPPTKLLSIAARLCREFIPSLEDHIEPIVDSPDLDIDPEDNFDDLRSFLGDLEILFFENERVQEEIGEIRERMHEGTELIAAKKMNSAHEWDGDDIAPGVVTAPSRSRSIFSDVDM